MFFLNVSSSFKINLLLCSIRASSSIFIFFNLLDVCLLLNLILKEALANPGITLSAELSMLIFVISKFVGWKSFVPLSNLISLSFFKISTIVVDQNQDAIAKAYADIFLCMDTSDPYRVIDAIEKECHKKGVSGVLVAGVELAVLGASISKHFKLVNQPRALWFFEFQIALHLLICLLLIVC